MAAKSVAGGAQLWAERHTGVADGPAEGHNFTSQST
jgi:hypothetical protein